MIFEGLSSKQMKRFFGRWKSDFKFSWHHKNSHHYDKYDVNCVEAIVTLLLAELIICYSLTGNLFETWGQILNLSSQVSAESKSESEYLLHNHTKPTFKLS